jgi:hypothetical protein
MWWARGGQEAKAARCKTCKRQGAGGKRQERGKREAREREERGKREARERQERGKREARERQNVRCIRHLEEVRGHTLPLACLLSGAVIAYVTLSYVEKKAPQ